MTPLEAYMGQLEAAARRERTERRSLEGGQASGSLRAPGRQVRMGLLGSLKLHINAQVLYPESTTAVGRACE